MDEYAWVHQGYSLQGALILVVGVWLAVKWYRTPRSMRPGGLGWVALGLGLRGSSWFISWMEFHGLMEDDYYGGSIYDWFMDTLGACEFSLFALGGVFVGIGVWGIWRDRKRGGCSERV